jgi:hypothetical protein
VGSELMKDDHENYTYTRRAFFHLPEYIFHVFKTHERRKSITANNSFTFIVENEWFRKELALKNETALTAKRFYSLSNASKLYGSLNHPSFNSNLKSYLSYHQMCKYKKCLDYIMEHKLPEHYSYYVLDFLTSTGNKFLHLSEESIFLNVSVRYILNIRAAYSGVGTPKPKETIYNTIPRAFSPLFYRQELVSKLEASLEKLNLLFARLKSGAPASEETGSNRALV